MLKYGDYQIMSNGNSKTMIPRNLTYRQKNLFKSLVSDNSIQNAFQSQSSASLSQNLSFEKSINISNKNKELITVIPSKITSNIDIQLNTGKINSHDTLQIKNLVEIDSSSNPIITYNIINNSQNYNEKKYLIKTMVDISSSEINFVFKNIIDLSSEQITFTGKSVSRNELNQSAHYTFSGYSKYVDASNNHTINVTTNTLYTPDSNKWKINTFIFDGVDLKVNIKSNQISKTNWIISLESINI